MARLVDVRLTAIGREATLRRLEDSEWQRILRARHVELYEFSEGRRVWWFQTQTLANRAMARLSLDWPVLQIFFEYEDCRRRTKGLVKASGGSIEHCWVSYSQTSH